MPLPDGQQIWLDLPSPGLLATLDPKAVGVAILDHLGYCRNAWGLAREIDYFAGKDSLLDTELDLLVEGAMKGTPGALYLDGFRYYVSGVSLRSQFAVFVLVTSAHDEKYARSLATRSALQADILKRVGTALTMNQRLEPLCIAAVHEIASAADLAAVMLWVRDEDQGMLHLRGSVGANRDGALILYELDPEKGLTCLAELVAVRREALSLKAVHEHPMASQLEAKFCYLSPGPICVLPLIVGEKLVGVLELIGKEGDDVFPKNRDLFGTLAEHLALALNSAILFENMERLASYDPLTGISNHRSMQDFLLKRVTEAKRTDGRLGVIMLDVDHFRSFNEEEGHDAGDAVLRLVVDALKANIRPYDLAARYGGEEFTVIMPGATPESLVRVAERIRKHIEEVEFVTRSGRVRHVTASLGCSMYPDTAEEPAHLLKAADLALYEAKRGGRNRTVLFEGTYSGEARTEESDDLQALDAWLDEADRAQANELEEFAKPFIEHLARELKLSPNQATILRGAVRLSPAYRRVRAGGKAEELRAMEMDNTLRSLVPSLLAMEERFDGEGPGKLAGERIPLLGRVLSVIFALHDERGEPFRSDPARFDAEIVSMIADVDAAA